MLTILEGSQSRWTEVGHGQSGREDCPVCRDRDLERERARNLDRICLRCLTWTWDLKGWIPPQPAGSLVERRRLFAPTPRKPIPSQPTESLPCSTS